MDPSVNDLMIEMINNQAEMISIFYIFLIIVVLIFIYKFFNIFF